MDPHTLEGNPHSYLRDCVQSMTNHAENDAKSFHNCIDKGYS